MLGVAVLAAAAFGYRTYSVKAQGAAWKALATKRERTVWTRYVTAFQDFLQGRDVGWGYELRTAYEGGWRGNYREEFMPMHGVLVQSGKVVGSIDPTFYFDGWNAEPSSAQFVLHVDRGFLAARRAGKTEFEYLLRQALAAPTFRTEFRGMQWFSTLDKGGNLDLSLKFSYPTRWLPSIAEYDRGFTDEMSFGHAVRVLKFLHREAFADLSVRVVLEPPVFNPPEPGGPNSLGGVNGYVLPSGSHEVVSLRISTSVYRGGTFLAIGFRGATKGWSRASAEKLFKPDFFPGMERWREGSEPHQSGLEDEETYVGFAVPLGFRIEDASLADLKKELATLDSGS